MHCECWIPAHCDATIEWERSGKVHKLAYLKALWRNRESNLKPHAGAGCWRHKRRLKTSLSFVIAPFANLGDLEMSSVQVGQVLRQDPTFFWIRWRSDETVASECSVLLIQTSYIYVSQSVLPTTHFGLLVIMDKIIQSSYKTFIT